jgi:hypothetical protein
MIYKCKKCNVEKHLLKTTLFFVNNELEVKEALCKCGIYMKQVDEEKYKGNPCIIRNERNGK